TPAKGELRFAVGDANEANELRLVIGLHRTVEVFVFPIWAPAHVQQSIRPRAAIHGDDALIVGQRYFWRGRLLRRDLEAVEQYAGFRGANLKMQGDFLAAGRDSGRLHGDRLLISYTLAG